MFEPKVHTIVVVGAQWGDEGKGKLVDVLAERADWVVRYQGGANAGHTVHIGDRSTVLHQIPSGILHPGVRCAIGNGVVLDPETLFTEVDELVRDGVDVEGRLYRQRPRAPRAARITSWWTRRARRARRSARRAAASARRTRTRSRGAGCASSTCAIPKRLRALVERGTEHANQLLASFGSAKRAEVEYSMGVLESLAPRLLAIADDVGLAIHRAIKSEKYLLPLLIARCIASPTSSAIASSRGASDFEHAHRVFHFGALAEP